MKWDLPKVLLTNLRSAAVPKFDDFATCVRQQQVDVAGISESWCHKDVPSSMLNIDGYNMVRRDRENRRGGGILLYIHDRFPLQGVVRAAY